MDIRKQVFGDRAEIQVTGRLDAYWAAHLSATLNEAVREGTHNISLDLSEVKFMSSAGIGALVRIYKQLQAIRGSLVISAASEQVTRLITISGLQAVLFPAMKPGGETADAVRASAAPRHGEPITRPKGTFEIFPLSEQSGLRASMIGNPGLLRGCKFRKENCSWQSFPEASFAVGVGTLGDSYEDCEGRFGEFLAAAGVVAYLPTDGTNVPDYFVPAGSSVATVQVCYAAAFEGPFAKMARFESDRNSGPMTLSDLVEACLEFSAAEKVGIVIVAETAGLIGAALRRPPIRATSEQSPFQFPDVRNWLTFTAERAYPRSLALVVGLAVRGDGGALAPALRPMGSNQDLSGHFHAAAFTYRHLQKGEIDLNVTVRSLFEAHSLQGVLHLLRDDRAVAGAGESEFVRGAIWMGPIL